MKKVWVRKEAKTPEVVTIKESQDVQISTKDATKGLQAKKIEGNAVTVNNGGLTMASSRSNRQPKAGLTEPRGRSD